ncbi:hypothetical protein [Vreelandella neptunia]|uniref:Uncharacterized protein n=1 Tax=Vreelandella neptunia TaxID=115551 RepID=A0ABZ0YTM4_9GAMM|nr:hypothetical protein [Halomonas neptunia]MDN3561689.1 hypothetical protein [Halomonas neptunia]WQH14591.1 hypothetical protein SR894_08640 [Halomonas neptunia]
MAENDTQKMLKSVLFSQMEILGRLDMIERHLGVDQSWMNESRAEAITALEYIVDSDFSEEIWQDLQPILRKISNFKDIKDH